MTSQDRQESIHWVKIKSACYFPAGPKWHWVKTEYGKALGEGLYEFRIRWTAAEISHKVTGLPAADIGGAPEEILLRAFFSTAGRKIILLLSGYDKARHSSDRWQQREIAEARRSLAAYRERQRRVK